MHKVRTINCGDCGTEIEVVQWNQKYCSDCGTKRGSKPHAGYHKKPCASCGEYFTPRTPRNNYCSDECKGRNAYYLKCYNMTQFEYKQMKSDRDNKCDICGGEGFILGKKGHTEKLCVDHDHNTGEVRGLLCQNCNRALGLLQDDVENLGRAIKYLESTKRKV